MELLFSCIWLAVVASLILRAVGQRGLLPRLVAAPSPPLEHAPQVAVIVPARDEEANIGPCVEALLAQDYPANRFSVLVIDDHSADGTAAIVNAIAESHAGVTLLAAPPLPLHWTGKSHACWTAARGVAPATEWLCFIDADVRARPALLSSALHSALSRRLDLLSLAPRQELESFAERLILPCGLVLLSFVQDLRRAQARSGSDVTATGQFMLVRRDAYEALGGHAAVCAAICEDLEFARRVKQSGRSVLLMGGEDFVSTRMYTGWRTLWPGLAKNLIDTLGGAAPTLAIALAAVVLAWAAPILPLIDLTDGALAALIVALAASGAAFGLHIAATFYFRIPFWYGLLFPLGYTVGALIALDSVRRRLRAQVSWKGRVYS